MSRPEHGSDPGWPRPRSRCVSDVAAGRAGERPTPWLALAGSRGWDPWEFREEAAAAMREHDLCQVCGEQRGDDVYVIERLALDSVMWGGALCSLRCARLVAAVCPHYRKVYPVTIWRVPTQARCDVIGSGEDNDDDYDDLGAVGVEVDVVGEAPIGEGA